MECKETMKHKHFQQKIVFIRCKKIDKSKKKKEAKKKTDKNWRRSQCKKKKKKKLTSAPFWIWLSSYLLPSSFNLSVYPLTPDEDKFLSKALVFPCFFVFRCIQYRWVHFPRSVLFCQPHQQLFTHSMFMSVFHLFPVFSQSSLSHILASCFAGSVRWRSVGFFVLLHTPRYCWLFLIM